MPQSITAAQLKAIAGAGARADLVAAIVLGWRLDLHGISRTSFDLIVEDEVSGREV